jgi:hypothetical protein
MRLTIITLVLALVPASWALAITATTVSFQNGINGYTGAFDRYINDGTSSATSPVIAQTDGSLVQTAILNGYSQGVTPDAQGLIRFDNIFGAGAGLIPSGAFILDAQLQLVTEGGATASATGQSNAATPTDISGSAGPFGVAALLQSFSSSTDYYTSYPNPGDPFGGRGPYYTANGGFSYSQRPVAGFGTAAVGQVASARITPIVQQWSSGALTNNGVAIQAGFTGVSDDWQIHTTGYNTPEGRPKLTVTYTTDPVTMTSFQPGVGGYADANVTMARVVGGASPATTDGATIAGDTGNFLDGLDATPTSEQLALIKFTNMFGNGAGQADPNKSVAKAWLVITTGTANVNARTNDPYDIDVMKNPWTTSTLYNQFGANTGLQWSDGDVQPSLDRLSSMASGSEAWYDVTSYVESIRNGATDNGLAIKPKQTDGWAIMFNGATDTTVRPRLVIASTTAAPGGGSPFGDFNNDTKVDAGDYATWRKNETANASLPNDNGLTTQAARYALWRANFGNTGSAPTPTAIVNYDLTGLPSSAPPATWDPNTVQQGGTTPVQLQNSSTSATGITGLPISRGAGIAIAGIANGFSANNWTNVTADGGTIDKARAIAMGDYFQFGLTVDASHKASLSTVDMTLRRSATAAPMNFELQYSLDGFATAGIPILLHGNSEWKYLGRVSGNAPEPSQVLLDPDRYMTLDSGGRPDAGLSPGDQIDTIDLSVIAGLQNLVNQTVTFRLYGWGDGAAGAANSNTVAFGRMNGPLVKGFVVPFPGSGTLTASVPEPSSILLIGTIAFAFGVCRKRRA